MARELTPDSIAGLISYAQPMVHADSAGGVVPWGGKLGKPIPAGPAYDRAFERYLVRAALDGSGHRDLDSLLRAVLTPNAAVEPGYRAYRVETHDGRLAGGFMVKHDENGATLRMMGGSDLQSPQKEIRRARYMNRSFMVPGLFDALQEQQVAYIIADIGTLKEDAAQPAAKPAAKPAPKGKPKRA